MAIYEYNEGDHNGQFQGLRVAVSIDSKVKQKYFSFRCNGKYVSLTKERTLRKEAKALEQQWKEEQAIFRAKRIANAIETFRGEPSYSTGVRGIQLKFAIENKFRGNEWRRYSYPVFIVSGSTKGVRFQDRFWINSGYEKAWINAVKFLAKSKGIKDYDHLIKRMPPQSRLKQAKDYLKSKGD